MEMKCKYVVYRAKPKNTANIATFQLNTDDSRLDEFGRSANVSLKSSPEFTVSGRRKSCSEKRK